MFDLFRSREKSVRILLGVLLGLVALSMLFYLIPGGFGNSGPSGQSSVASIGSEKITAVDVQRAVQNVTRGQQNLPKGLLAMYVPMIVNQMIEGKAMAYKAREMGLRISDQQLADTILAEVTPAMGGAFDKNTYQALLAQQGMTVADFENSQRDGLLASRLENLESQSLIVSEQDAKAEYQRKNLKVGLQYIAFDSKDFAAKVNKDPAALKAYFDKNRSQFRTQEKRSFDLIVGATADFVQNAKISDADLQRRYQEGIESYRVPERVQVRHILIKTQGKPKEQVAALKTKADDILKQLQQGGDFADLAKKNSEDPGSAPKGGELGWIVRGQTVPNFEKTAFSLNPGQTSGVVETEYGYHILQLEAKQTAHTQAFEEVRPQLLAEAQKQAGGDELKKAMDAAHAEILHTPAQAEAIARKYNLKFFKLDNFTSGQSMPEVNTQPQVMNAVFAAPKGGVTDVIDLGTQGKDALAVITNVSPARQAEYAEVQDQVLSNYVSPESAQLAAAAAKNAAAGARKGDTLEALAKQYGGQLKTASPFTMDGAAEGIGPASLVASAFKGKVGDVIGPVSAQTSQFVCKVSEKTPADMSQFAQNKDALMQSLTEQRKQIQQPLFRNSVVSELKRRGKIKINQDALDRVVGSYQS